MTEEQKKRIIKVKKLYDKYGTLEKVGDYMGITRERVRQLLEKGHKNKLFHYELTRDKKFKDIIGRISKEQLTWEILNVSNKFDICSNLNITPNIFFKLMGHYKIDIEGYRYDARFRKCITEYAHLVDSLGYHPSTTIMQSTNKGHALSTRIEKLWGGIDQFRNAFGIEKPPHRVSPRTREALRRLEERRTDNMNKKIYRVYEIIKNTGPIGCRKISELTGISYPTIYAYIKNMISEKKVKRVGPQNATQYQTT